MRTSFMEVLPAKQLPSAMGKIETQQGRTKSGFNRKKKLAKSFRQGR